MTQHISNRDTRQGSKTAARPALPFKDVALPALAAAIRVGKQPTRRPKTPSLPAFLREEALQS